MAADSKTIVAGRACVYLTYVALALMTTVDSARAAADGVLCNSQYAHQGSDASAATCAKDVCYHRLTYDVKGQSSVSIESGCSDEFQSNFINHCVALQEDDKTFSRRKIVCACDDSKNCNAVNSWRGRDILNHQPHFRKLKCLCENNACNPPKEGCEMDNRTYCMVASEREGAHCGYVEYIGYEERAAQKSPTANEWLCETDSANADTVYRCTCRTGVCDYRDVRKDDVRIARIDQSTSHVLCKQYDSDKPGPNRTCYGHVCYTTYRRTMRKVNGKSLTVNNAPPIGLWLGCKNFTKPSLYYGWAYRNEAGLVQNGQQFCRSNMCNNYTEANVTKDDFYLRSVSVASYVNTTYARLISVFSTAIIFIWTKCMIDF